MEFAMFDKPKSNKPTIPPIHEPFANESQAAAPAPTSPAAGKAGVIGAGIVINGDISGSENLAIEGKVKGHIHLPGHEVLIGQNGEIQANVTAKLIRVSGKVHGDLSGTEKVVISKTGNVRGNIVSPRVLLEDGAVFKGSIDMDPGEAAGGQMPLSASRTPLKSSVPAEAAPDASKKSPDLALKSG